MPNTREKLIELLNAVDGVCPKDASCYDCEYKDVTHCAIPAKADHLIANGVTVQKRGYWVIKNIKNSKYRYCFCSECKTMGSTEWKCCPVCETKMDLPQPPKGE